MVDLSRFPRRRNAPAPRRDPIESIIADIDREQGRASLLDDTSPADAIESKRLSRSLGYPAEAISAAPKDFKVEFEQAEWEKILATPGGLTRFLSRSPLNGAAAKDDREALAATSRLWGTAEMNGDPLGQNFMRSMRARLRESSIFESPTPSYKSPLLRDLQLGKPVEPLRALRDYTGPSDNRPRFTGMGSVVKGVAAQTSALIGSAGLGAAGMVAGALGVGDDFVQSDYYARTQAEIGRARDEGDLQFNPLGTVGGIEINPGAWAYSATNSLTLLGASIVTGNPVLALSTVSGLDAVNRFRGRGASNDEASIAGFATGAIEGITERYSLGFLTSKFGKIGASKFVSGFLARELGGELAATTGQNLIDAVVTGGVGFDQYLKNLPQDLVDTAGATLLMGGALGALNSGARRLRPQAQAADEIGRATAGAAWLDQLMTNAGNSKLRAADPESFREFVEEHTADSPVRDIYVPVEAIRELQQSEGYEPGFFERYEEQIAQAEATQGDVVIPIAEAAAELAGTPLWEGIKEQVRIYPGGLSQKEALEQHGEIMRTLEQRGAEIAQEMQEGTPSPATEVYTEVRNRLLAGNVPSRQAEQIAQVYAARYEARADRMGGTPMEQFQKSKIVFPGERAGRTEGREVAQSAFENVEGLLDRDDWALMTAENPDAQQLTEEENTARLEELKTTLDSLGLKYTEVRGKYDNEERSLAIEGIDEATARRLGARFGQDSVLTRRGLIYRDGRINPARGVSLLDKDADNYFTELPDGRKFSVDIDFDTTERTLHQDDSLPPDEQVASAAGAFEFARSQKFKTIRDFKEGLQARILAATKKPRDAARIIRLALSDAQQGLRENANAVGWYNEKVTKALDVLALIHPEIRTDENARFAFIFALAVTSNGLKVDRNFKLASQVYQIYKDTGRFPDTGEGTAAEAMGKSLALFNSLNEAMGLEGMRELMLGRYTVGQLKKMGFTVGGEHTKTEVYGAAVLGPKIGNGFFMNLYGRFDQLTMDRWFIRTWGRWTGTLIEVDKVKVKAKRDALATVVRGMTPAQRKAVEAAISPKRTPFKIKLSDIDGLAERVAGATTKAEVRTVLAGIPGGNRLRLDARAYIQLRDGQKEMPAGPAERNEIRGIMSQVLDQLQVDNPALTMADLQAVLWYPEKTLYDTAKGSGQGAEGYADDEAPDYANAAVALAKSEGIEDGRIAETIRAADDRLAAEERAGGAGRGAGSARSGQGRTLNQDVMEVDDRGVTTTAPGRVTLFHGTPFEFDTFSAAGGKAVWFATDRKLAERYADGRRFRKRTAGRVITVDVEINNPLMIAEDGVVEDPVQWAQETFGFDLKAHGWERTGQSYVHDITRSGAFAAAARAAGHDAIGIDEGGNLTWGILNEGAVIEQGTGRTLYQGDVFYSAAEKVVADAKPAKATAEQWKALLTPGKTPGIKAEEIEWSGIHDWLDMQEGPISKDVLLQVLQDRGIKVEEVVLGGPDPDAQAEYRIEERDQDGEPRYDIYYKDDASPYERGYASREAAQTAIERVTATQTQFKSWSSDNSNDTYRELLITLPIGQGGNPGRAPSTHWDTESVVAHTRFMEKTDAEGKRVLFIEEVQSDWHQKGRDQGYEQPLSDEQRAKVDAISAQVREAQEVLDEIELDMSRQEKKLTEVVGPKLREAYAKMVSDLEEVAKTNPKVTPEAVDAFKHVMAARTGDNFFSHWQGDSRVSVRQVEDWANAADLDDQDVRSRIEDLNNLQREKSNILNRQMLYENELRVAKGGNKGIPEAPFKTSWPALVMKRVIRWAVDHGYERVAWTTGKEQSERYNLSQAVGSLTASRNEDGTYYVTSSSSYDANRIMAEQNGGSPTYSPEKLREILGADVSRRLIEGADAAAGSDFVLADEDLNVGGEGMRAFYDRNLVNITNDIIKRYGAKVGKVVMHDDTNTYDELIQGYEDQLVAAQRIGDPQSEIDDIAAHIERLKEQKARALANFTNPGFEITDKMRDAARGGFTLFQNPQGPRGSVTFTTSGERVIQLFETANASTLLHESSHIWLEELREDAADPAAPQQVRDDWAKIEAWFASQGHPVQPGIPIPTAAHELFARGGERYFMEGKAPSAQLSGAFRLFRAWLMRIYQVVQNLRSPINDDVRGVFDRLLATQEAIDTYREQAGVTPLFKTAADAGMTDAEFAAYQRSIVEAKDEAYDAMLFRTMEAIRRQRQGEQRTRRRNIRDEVAAEINARPEFVALHLLRTGMWLGDPERPRQDVKLNTGWLIDTFGEGVLEQLPRGLPIIRGDGQDGDLVAEMVGAESGQQLVQALIGMRVASEQIKAEGEKRSLRDKLIDERTDQIMADRYGDPINDGSIEEEAVAALNTARQGEIIAQEARQLAKRTATVTQPLTPYQFAREWAKRVIAEGKVVDVASRSAVQRYTRATAKAQRAAEKAILEGDTEEAYRQKQAQLLNHALLVESKKAADDIDSIVSRMRKLAGRAAMKSVDQDYLDKVHMLLERFDFRPRSQKSIDEAEGFQAWLEDQRAKGFEVHIPPRLENAGEPYSRVTVAELQSLNDLVQSLIHLGRTKQKLTVAKKERDFAEFRDEVAARIRQLPIRKLPAKPINEEPRRLASVTSELMKVEVIVEELDGGKTGPLHDALILGATQAENKRNVLRQRVLMPIVRAYQGMSGKMQRRMAEKVTLDGLTWNTLNEGDPRQGTPVTITRSELMSIFLNMGNLSNLEKLSKGERWPVVALQRAVQANFTKEDYDFAQLLWDQVNSLWPEIVANERELSGVVPEQVTPMPIDTPFGTYAGGYWPVVYDAARWQRAEDLADAKLDDMFGIKSGVATQKGHTISRTEAFGPFELSLENVLFQHLEQVVTRIAFSAYARDSLRIIRDKTIRGLIDTHLGPEYRRQFEPWLGRQIQQGVTHAKAAKWWQKVLRQTRINMTVAAMGFRFSTGVAQTLGLTASAQRIGARYVGVGLKRVATSPRRMAEFAFSRSQELTDRTGTMNREVTEVFDKLRGKHSKLTEAQAWAFWHIGMIDRYLVALPTWIGAHTKGMAEGMTDEEASAYADKEVRLSQGSGVEKDLSAWQSPNNEAMRFFTMFYTPFNVMFNQQWQGVRGLKKGELRPLIGVTFWWLVASTLGDALLSGDLPDADDDDNGAWDEWLSWFGRNVFFGMFAGIPLVRDASNYAERKIQGEYSSLNMTPVGKVIEAGEKAVRMTEKAVVDGEAPGRPIKQTADVTAVLTGVPISQAGTSGQFLWDYSQGDADPQSVSDWYFGVTRGKVPEKDGAD